MRQENVYLQRINAVIDYIREHMTEDVSLDALARIACFSPFHFHRIFTAVTGETVNQFVRRLRLERAAALMKATPELPVAEAAFLCGFESASNFSRSFKTHFGVSPRSWDRHSPLKDRKNGQVLEGFPQYTLSMLQEVADAGEFSIRCYSLPPRRMVYLRVANSYQPDRVIAAYDRLITWYRARGGEPTQATLIGMSQDDPDITPLELCRYDWCLDAPDDWGADGEVSVRIFPACNVVSIHCVGDIYRVDRAWQYLYRYWLPRSRHQPDNLPAMELYRRQPCELGWEQYDLECVGPIVSF
jgi:AraC family transcriptional regulator